MPVQGPPLHIVPPTASAGSAEGSQSIFISQCSSNRPPTLPGLMMGRLWSPILVIAGQGIQSATNFLIGVLLARYASLTALGDYALGATIVFVVGSLTETLIATPYTYLVLRNRSSRGQGTALGAAMVATAMLTACGAAVAALLLVIMPGLGYLFPAMPSALALTLLREMIRRRHYAHGQPGRALVSDIITAVVQFSIIAWLIQSGLLDAASVFFAIAAACLVAIGAGWPGLRREVIFPTKLLLGYCRRFFRIGRWLTLGGVCQIVAIQSYSWFLFVLADARATGAFTACLAVSSLPNPFLVGLTNYARPAIIRAYATSGWVALLRQTLVLAAAFVLPVALFALASASSGGRLLILIYGPDLRWAADSLTWMIIALIAIASGAPLQLLMLAIHRPQAIFHLHLGELIATYAVGLPLVVAFGLTGAAIGYLMSALAGAAVLGAAFIIEWRSRAAATMTRPGTS